MAVYAEVYKVVAHGGHILARFVDDETQKMLASGRSCRIYMRLAPRCSINVCEEDRFDHCLVCNTCALVYEGATFGKANTSRSSALTADARAEYARLRNISP